jgi:hypothetical protein
MTDSLKPERYKDPIDESDDQEEEFSWEDLKEGDKEILQSWLLPEAGDVERIDHPGVVDDIGEGD